MGRISYVNVYLCLFFVSLLSACGPQPVQSIQDPALAKLASEARELALTWLDDSERSSFFEVRTNYQDGVAAVLESRSIRVAPAAHKASCQPVNGGVVAAFVTSAANSDIFICPQSETYGKYFLAQVLIHEAIHLTGQRDECETTRIEAEIMTQAYQTPYRSAYTERCGIDTSTYLN